MAFPCNQFGGQMPIGDGEDMVCHLKKREADIGDVFAKVKIHHYSPTILPWYIFSKIRLYFRSTVMETPPVHCTNISRTKLLVPRLGPQSSGISSNSWWTKRAKWSTVMHRRRTQWILQLISMTFSNHTFYEQPR